MEVKRIEGKWWVVYLYFISFQLIRTKEVRIDIEVKRSEEKWRDVMTCDVSPVAMFLDALASLALMIVTHWLTETWDWQFLTFGSSLPPRLSVSLVTIDHNWHLAKFSVLSRAFLYRFSVLSNIVQTAFDPLPPRFEHVCCKFFERVLKKCVNVCSLLT